MAYDSKKALLAGIIDYAGQFPPAALPLPDALRRAATYRSQGKHPWLMGKIAVTMAELKKIDQKALFEAGADGDAWLFTALGKPSEGDPDAFLRAIEWDLREIRHYNERGFDAPIRAWVVGYETKLPKEAAAGEVDDAFEFLAPVLDRFSDLARVRLDPFFEVGFDGEWKKGLATVLEALGQWSEDDEDGRVMPGVKIRTGGEKVPSSQSIAEVILACARYGLRFKATQGLHHAITREGAFGFVNLFGALNLAHGLGPEKFGHEAICRCLDDKSAASFRFDADAFAWNDFRLPLESIESARKRHGATFGSCSLDEPDEALSTELSA